MTVLTNTFTFFFATSLVATQSLAIAAAPLMIGVFVGGLMGGLMVVQDFKLRKKADIFLEEASAPVAPTAPASIVRQSVRQPFKRLVRG
jgi:hypothetical protein